MEVGRYSVYTGSLTGSPRMLLINSTTRDFQVPSTVCVRSESDKNR